MTYLELLKAILDRGANPDLQLKKLWFQPTFHDQMWVGTPGSTAFWRAAQATDLAACVCLYRMASIRRFLPDEGDTALMMAAGAGWAGTFSRSAPDLALDAVRFCVELGLDVNTQDVTGYLALAGAAWRGGGELVGYLAGKGAKLNVRTARNRSSPTWPLVPISRPPVERRIRKPSICSSSRVRHPSRPIRTKIFWVLRRREHLARVQDASRIERFPDGPHGSQLRFRSRTSQEIPLHRPDAVFSGNGPAITLDQRIQNAVHGLVGARRD